MCQGMIEGHQHWQEEETWRLACHERWNLALGLWKWPGVTQNLASSLVHPEELDRDSREGDQASGLPSLPWLISGLCAQGSGFWHHSAWGAQRMEQALGITGGFAESLKLLQPEAGRTRAAHPSRAGETSTSHE